MSLSGSRSGAAEPGTGQVGAGQATAVSSLRTEPDGGALRTTGYSFPCLKQMNPKKNDFATIVLKVEKTNHVSQLGKRMLCQSSPGDTSWPPDCRPLPRLRPRDGQNICHGGCRRPSVVRASGEGAACSASRHGTHGYLQQRCSLTGKWSSSRSKLSSGFRQESAPARLFRTAAVTSPSASPILCPPNPPAP